MDKKEFEAWIDSKLNSFAHVLPDKRKPWVKMDNKLNIEDVDYSHPNISEFIGNFFIVCNLFTGETTIFNIVTKRRATARCNIEDKFDVRTGIAVAWARYNHEIIPDYENIISREELVNGDKFFSSLNKNRVNTFVGWLPYAATGSVGKFAAIINENGVLLKTQIKEQVVKIN
jgi:hypothetical protein